MLLSDCFLVTKMEKMSKFICLQIFISKSDKSKALLADHQADDREPQVVSGQEVENRCSADHLQKHGLQMKQEEEKKDGVILCSKPLK